MKNERLLMLTIGLKRLREVESARNAESKVIMSAKSNDDDRPDSKWNAYANGLCSRKHEVCLDNYSEVSLTHQQFLTSFPRWRYRIRGSIRNTTIIDTVGHLEGFFFDCLSGR